MSKPEEIVTINTVEQFSKILSAWHSQAIERTKHLLTVPEGAEFTVGEGEEESTVSLSGAGLAGFKFGVELALMQLSVLPFVAETEEEPAPSDVPN
jgi:hypothetical protein